MNEIFELKLHHDCYRKGDWQVLVESNFYCKEISFFLNHNDYGTYMFCFGIPMEDLEDPWALIEHCFDEYKETYKEIYFDENEDTEC